MPFRVLGTPDAGVQFEIMNDVLTVIVHDLWRIARS